ncbi:MAG: hypothetical protein GDA43_15410 [Hormoscilla sp. SP5CHS1]|nr:hypothetical protein [Hormoscilla sp. SP12CHS1]MBC6454410.1 hypothetical protein [Hormoscilla sp. SP5CHS1]
MNQLTRSEQNGKIPGKRKEWLQRSVGEFFTGVNWDLQPLEVQQLKQAAWQGSLEPLSQMLSVTQFFSCFAWEGSKVAAPVPETSKPAAQEGSNEFTLDDFSSLF